MPKASGWGDLFICGAPHPVEHRAMRDTRRPRERASLVSTPTGEGQKEMRRPPVSFAMALGCRSVRAAIALNVSISHRQRFVFFFRAVLRPADDFIFFAPDFFAAFFVAFVAVNLAAFFFVDFFADFLGGAAFATVFFCTARFFLAGAANSGAGTAAVSVASGNSRRRLRLQSIGGPLARERKFDVLSASSMILARSDFECACSTCNFLRSAFSRLLSSVTSPTRSAMSTLKADARF
jgi:hypothetical protein